MIIELDPVFREFDSTQWDPYSQAVQNLIQAHQSGWHAFSPDRGVCKSLIAFADLSRGQKGVIARIAEKASILGGQAQAVEKVILCRPDNLPERTLRANQISLPLQSFRSLDHCRPSRLLTENAANDGALLELLCDLMHRDIDHFAPLKIEQIHGGGSTTGEQFKKACEHPRPTLCVIDSDQTYPASALGSTARSVTSHHTNNHHPIVESFILPVRELENAIPISTLYDIYSSDPHVRVRIDPLHKYICKIRDEEISPDENVIDFFDFKCGLKFKHIASIPEQHRAAFIRFSKLALQQCSETEDFSDANDDRTIHPGISVNMLNRTIEYLNSAPNRKEFCQRMKSSPNWPWLKKLLRLILAYGVGGERCASAA